MKFVALVSGGKDSIYSILECRRHGHELLGCVHLGAALEQDEESYMYQSAASEALTTLVEDCLGVPLIHYRRVGKSLNTSLIYQEALNGDEVEDLYQALSMAKEKFAPDLQAVSSGAILSTYQRVRIEHVCSRLQLTSLSYLWRAAPQHDLLDRMVRDGIHAVLVRSACPPGLIPQKHLNKSLQELQPHFLRLNQRYQFHVCGEGGEYESLVLDCPLYRKKLVLDQVEVVELEGDEGVGVLKIIKCHAEEKSTTDPQQEGSSQAEAKATKIQPLPPKPATASHSSETNATSVTTTEDTLQTTNTVKIRNLPRIKRLGGGLWHVSELMVPVVPTPQKPQPEDGSSFYSEAELAVQEAKVVLEMLQILLHKNGCTAQDVLFVHLYLSEISHFARINASYSQFFGTVLPPSRSCVAVGPHVLPGGRRVLLDCMVQCGSGDYLRGLPQPGYAQAALENTSSYLRQVLHVQSISHWAPICVGPYSQVNTRSGLHFMAGQIGLTPATMTLHPEWKDQLHQCWTNVANVLDALDGGGSSLAQLLSGIVYVEDNVYFNHIVMADAGQKELVPAIQDVESICRFELERNGGVVAGKVDSPIAVVPNEEDRDNEETDQVDKRPMCPLLVVSIPEMPVGSKVEVEVSAATRQAFSCLSKTDTKMSLEMENAKCSLHSGTVMWDTGHDFPLVVAKGGGSKSSSVNIQVTMRTLGSGCAGVATITAGHWLRGVLPTDTVDVDIDQVLGDMLGAFATSLTAPSEAGGQTFGLELSDVLHVRLFYIASNIQGSSGEKIIHDDGLLLRSSLQSALALRFASSPGTTKSIIPASSVIPVQAINLLQMKDRLCPVATQSESVFMALQILVIDPVHLESDIWVHDGR